MLIGRGTYEAAKRMPDAAKDYGGGWSGPVFVLTHRPPEPQDPADLEPVSSMRSGAVTILRFRVRK